MRLLAAFSPTNFSEEVARLGAAFARGGAEVPRFEYAAAQDLSGVAAACEELASRLGGGGDLAEVYRARALELALEAELIAERDGPRVRPIARDRFSFEGEVSRRADESAAAWLEGAPPAVEVEALLSDDEADPRSLLCRARAEIGRLRLPVRVVVVASLAPLAAVGERLLQIAGGRVVSVVDVERTVLHEIEGHLLPMHRAAAQPEPLFELGSARGSEGQEGYALLLEARRGFLTPARRRELALRHVAGRAIHAGVPFAEVVGDLKARGAENADAVRIAARVSRGGGLAREVGYIPALLEISDAVEVDPELEPVIGSGRVSAAAARVLRPLARSASP